MGKTLITFMLVLCFLVTTLGLSFSTDFFKVGSDILIPVTELVGRVSKTVTDLVFGVNYTEDTEIQLVRKRIEIDGVEYYFDLIRKQNTSLFTLVYSSFPDYYSRCDYSSYTVLLGRQHKITVDEEVVETYFSLGSDWLIGDDDAQNCTYIDADLTVHTLTYGYYMTNIRYDGNNKFFDNYSRF